ncbi:MAG: hypothetical protein AABY68_03220 [Pseudomonadota bacterium]
MAVLLEPITFSGERITAAVAVVPADSSAPRVITTLALEPMTAVFGRYGAQLYNLAGMVTAELQAYLATGGALESWQPSLQGVFAGQIVPTKNTGLESIIQSALTHSSLFSAKLNDEIQDEAADRASSKFQTTIRDLVVTTRQDFSRRFNAKMKLYGQNTTLSYVGTSLAMNLATLDTTGSSHAHQCAVAQRKINQLLRLRDMPSLGHRYDSLILGIWAPATELNKAHSELLDSYTEELDFATKKHDVTLQVAHGDMEIKEAARPFATVILADN